MLYKTRKEAAKANQHLYLGQPCVHGHHEGRYVVNFDCVVCAKARTKRNAEKYRERHNRYRREARAGIRKRNKKKVEDYAAYIKVKDKKQKQRPCYRKNKAYNAALRSRELKRRMLWGEDEVRRIYAECPDGWHVDHIIPVNGETVCGLHVPENLQHLPAKINQAKGNSFDEGGIS